MERGIAKLNELIQMNYENPGLPGEVYMKHLKELDEKLYNQIKGTEYDPRNSTCTMASFFAYLVRNWERMEGDDR